MTDYIVIAVMCSVLFGLGGSIGNDMGKEKACKSVNLEWVKDKCMKVTREEVK